MNEHPRSSLIPYVLDSLNIDETIRVAEHLAICPLCRSHVEAFRACVDVLSAPVPGTYAPPAHVKRRLFDRVDAEARPRERPDGASGTPGRARPWPSRYARWIGALAALSLALALALGLLTVDARRQLDHEQQMVAFITAPATVAQPLAATPRAASAGAKMYMQPGHTQAMLIVAGLHQPGAGKIYQFWLASPQGQVPAGTFSVKPDGTAELFLDAPRPLDTYAQVLVTIEPAGGSPAPSDEIVLAASL